jgi:hypothetical protein
MNGIVTQPLIGKRHALGHHQIDTDHLAIASWWMRVTQCAPVSLPFHILGLRKVMRDHFARETALVEAAGTHFCACHQNEHGVLLELCDDAYALTRHNLRAARSLLRTRMPRLMRDHINIMDQIAVLIIREAAGPSLSSLAPFR